MSYSQALEKTIAFERRMNVGGSFWNRVDQVAAARSVYARTAPSGADADPQDPKGLVHRLRFSRGMLARTLKYGDTFHWDAAICDLIDSTYSTMPPLVLTAEHVPSPWGVFWFGRAFAASESLYQELNGEHALVGVSWAVARDADDPQFGIPLSEAEAIFLTPILHDGTKMWPSPPDVWHIGETSVSAANIQGDAEGAMSTARFACMLAFLQQRILIAPRCMVDRPARRRLERAGYQHEPLVRVVELRRKQSRPAHDGEQTAVDWACQWITRGHWRNQWYPSLGAYQPRWIMPFVKGPPEKPLKPPRATVFAVVR